VQTLSRILPRKLIQLLEDSFLPQSVECKIIEMPVKVVFHDIEIFCVFFLYETRLYC